MCNHRKYQLINKQITCKLTSCHNVFKQLMSAATALGFDNFSKSFPIKLFTVTIYNSIHCKYSITWNYIRRRSAITTIPGCIRLVIVLITLAIFKIPSRVFAIKLADADSFWTHWLIAHYIRSDYITSHYNMMLYSILRNDLVCVEWDAKLHEWMKWNESAVI